MVSRSRMVQRGRQRRLDPIAGTGHRLDDRRVSPLAAQPADRHLGHRRERIAPPPVPAPPPGRTTPPPAPPPPPPTAPPHPRPPGTRGGPRPGATRRKR